MSKKIIALMTIVAILMTTIVVASAAPPSIQTEVAPSISDAVAPDGSALPTGDLIVTPLGEADELPPENEAELKQAYEDVRTAETLEEFVTDIGLKNDVDGALDGTGKEINDLTVNSLFDVRATGTVADALAKQGYVTITFRIPTIRKNDIVIVLHKGGVDWEVVPSEAGDGFVKATFTSLSPVMILTEKDPTTGGGTVDGPQTSDISFAGVLFGVVALTTVAVLGSKKRKA